MARPIHGILELGGELGVQPTPFLRAESRVRAGGEERVVEARHAIGDVHDAGRDDLVEGLESVQPFEKRERCLRQHA
jgi:hypothetical protein